ncbi:MAG: acetylxylan esterase [Planctomycetota bacterium]
MADLLRQHVVRRTQLAIEKGDRRRAGLDCPGALKAFQEELRVYFLRSIGGLPDDAALEPTVKRCLETDAFTIDAVTYQPRAGERVTANLYLPLDQNEPVPAVLFLSGHFLTAKTHPDYQSVCQRLVRSGMAVLAIDPIGQGERLTFALHDPDAGEPMWGIEEHDTLGKACQLLGVSLARYFLHDAMRGIDYLLSRPEVDPTRIGATGNSGGGTQTSMLMMAEPRLSAAAPATFIMDRASYQRSGQAQDAEQIWPGFTAAGYDHADVLLAMAPRPTAVLAAAWDFFPIEGTRRSVAIARQTAERCGVEIDLRLIEDEVDHQYSPALASASARFFASAFGLPEDASASALDAVQPVAEEKLWCTRTGQIRGDDPDAPTVLSDFAYLAESLGKSNSAAAPADGSGHDATVWLRDQVYRDQALVDPNPRRHWAGTMPGLKYSAWWWRTQEDLLNFGLVCDPLGGFDGKDAIIAVWPGGTRRLREHLPWLRGQVHAGRRVLVLDYSGIGRVEPRRVGGRSNERFYGAWHKLNDDLGFLGSSLTALAALDVLQASVVLRRHLEPGAHALHLYGVGLETRPALLAAHLDPHIKNSEACGLEPDLRGLIGRGELSEGDALWSGPPGLLRYPGLLSPS